MTTPIQVRLTLNTLLVLVVAIALGSGLAWVAVEHLYLDTQRENLLAQAQLIATAMEGSALPAGLAGPYVQTANVLPGIHTRLLSDNGAVMIGLPLAGAESYVPVPLAEQSQPVEPGELMGRPEIRSALSGTPASAVRRVASAENRRVLYAAAPVYTHEGVLNGIAYLATPLPASGLPPQLALQLLGSVLLAVVLASLAGRRLAHRIAGPLQDLASASQGLAGGDLRYRAPLHTAITELQLVGQSFNLMADNLEKADRTQKAFIANVTHELRTPLTVIKGTIETLEDGALDDITGRVTLLDSMHHETDRLIRLVNELLVLARADAGELKLDLQTVNLGDLARSRCKALRLLKLSKRVELLVTDQTGGNCTVRADQDRLAQVLDNLLQNAIRHAPAGSPVTVSIGRAHGGLDCAVHDTGPGIEARHLPHLFERFYRIETARDRKRGGTGLGLAITRAIVQAHGGQIAVVSQPGQGATFTFWLPTFEPASEPPDS